MKACGLRPCDKFRPLSTNPEVCAWVTIKNQCSKPGEYLLSCPWKGLRNETRPYEITDTEEDSFE